MSDVTELAKDYSATLNRLQDANRAAALQAAGALLILGEKLATMAQLSDDPEVVRKAYDSFGRKAEVPEKQEAQKQVATAAAAVLQIILDDNVPQVAPKRRPRAVQEDVVDVDPLPAAPAPAPAELSWGDAL